jgi:hypothetical protein
MAGGNANLACPGGANDGPAPAAGPVDKAGQIGEILALPTGGTLHEPPAKIEPAKTGRGDASDALSPCF